MSWDDCKWGEFIIVMSGLSGLGWMVRFTLLLICTRAW